MATRPRAVRGRRSGRRTRPARWRANLARRAGQQLRDAAVVDRLRIPTRSATQVSGGLAALLELHRIAAHGGDPAGLQCGLPDALQRRSGGAANLQHRAGLDRQRALAPERRAAATDLQHLHERADRLLQRVDRASQLGRRGAGPRVRESRGSAGPAGTRGASACRQALRAGSSAAASTPTSEATKILREVAARSMRATTPQPLPALSGTTAIEGAAALHQLVPLAFGPLRVLLSFRQ